MMMSALPSAALMVAADQLDMSLLNLDSARVSLAGPDLVYVSSIKYAGENYSALLKYQGGTTATVEQVFGPNGVLISPSVGLAQTELAFVPARCTGHLLRRGGRTGLLRAVAPRR